MRIALLNEITQPGAGGGCEAHLAALWRGLAERDHTVRLDGTTWHEAVGWGDVVHIHNMTQLGIETVLAVCARLAKPTLISLHDYWPFCRSRMAVHGGRNCHREGCHAQCGLAAPPWLEAVRRVPCVSFTLRAAEIFQAHGIESTVIPHGLNLEFWHPKPRAAHEGPVRVACCTAWGTSVWKGLHVAREAEELLGELAEFRSILGGQPREAVRELYWWADVVLVPSIYEETFCLVAAEAQACSRPVVAFAVGGLRELASVVVPEGDSSALARAILAHQELPLRIIRSYQEMAADYEALYHQLLEHRAPLAAGMPAC